MDPRRNDIALLFSLAALPIAACTTGVDNMTSPFSPTVGSSATTPGSGGDEDTGDGEETGEDDGPTSASGSGPADGSGNPSTTAGPATTDPTGASMTQGSSASMTGYSTYGSTYGGTYGGSYGSYGGTYGGTGGMLPPVCYQFVDHYLECNPMVNPQELAEYCAYDLTYGSMYSAQCGSALEEFYACMGMADCGEIAMGDPCGGQALGDVCGGGGGGGP